MSIARELGAGGRTVGEAVASALGAALLDVRVPGRHACLGDVARGAFAVSVERFIRCEGALRLAADETAVHDARVCVRRLRSDLRTFSALLDVSWAAALRERLRWPQDVLSAARDADVVIESVRRASAALSESDRRIVEDVLAPLRAARERAYDVVRAMLQDPRYEPLLCAMIDAVKHPPLNARADEPAAGAIAEILGGGWKTLRRRVRERSRPPSDRELHGIRIAAKRVRYAAEAVAPVAGRRAERFGRDAERLQTVLGDQHDAVLAGQRLRSLGADGAQAFVAGELAAVTSAAERAARRSWRDAWRAAKRTYRRLR